MAVTPKSQLEESLDFYLEKVWGERDSEVRERIKSGVFSFIAVQIWDQPYVPMLSVGIVKEPGFFKKLVENLAKRIMYPLRKVNVK